MEGQNVSHPVGDLWASLICSMASTRFPYALDTAACPGQGWLSYQWNSASQAVNGRRVLITGSDHLFFCFIKRATLDQHVGILCWLLACFIQSAWGYLQGICVGQPPHWHTLNRHFASLVHIVCKSSSPSVSCLACLLLQDCCPSLRG